MRLFITGVICLNLSACLSISPELEWEDVTSNHEPVLNVLGLISADSIVTSFVRVHRSLRMDEAEDTLVRDTIGGNIFIYYSSIKITSFCHPRISHFLYHFSLFFYVINGFLICF